MPADGPLASVTDITDLVGDRPDRELRRLFAVMRATVFEPPASLLPAVYARLDDTTRFPRLAPTRWVAVAAGAAGAVVIASRSRRLLAG